MKTTWWRTIRTPRGSRAALLGLLVSGLVLAACGGTPSASKHVTHKTTTTIAPTTTSTTPTGGSVPLAVPCSGSALSGQQVTFGDAAQGKAAVTVVAVTNTSKSTCSLDGYPGLHMISPKGANLPTTVQQGGTGIPANLAVQGVNLAARGGQASFMLYWEVVPTATQPTCPVATKMTVGVGSGSTFTMKAEINACGGILQASPFEAGIVPITKG